MTQSPFVWDAGAVTDGLIEVGRSRPVRLGHLKYLLDEFQGSEQTLEYYDLVAGDWLEILAHNIYCVWREVLAGSWVDEASPIPVIVSTKDAQVKATEGEWHRHLRWAVWQVLNGHRSGNWSVQVCDPEPEGIRRYDFAKRVLRSISTSKPEVLLAQPYFKCSHLESLGALWKWRSWIAWDDIQYPVPVAFVADWSWRKRQSEEVSPTLGSFSELVMCLMPLYIPIVLLEGHKNYRAAVMDLRVPRPRAVYSANALHGHSAAKLLFAEWRQQGTKILYHQHGGGYGYAPEMPIEDYEIRVSDRFYSWGWQREGLHVYPLSPAMPAVRRSHQSKNILLNCWDLPNVPYQLMYKPMPGTIEIMHRESCEFLAESLDHRNLVIRPYPNDFGWGVVKLMQALAPEAQFDRRPSNQISFYASCRLVVHSYLGTSWLETLGLNIPTICFYDPGTYLFREDANPYIEALQMVGILHCSGKDAARFVTSLGNDVDGWWNKAEVQTARQSFVEKYANFSSDWVNQWEQEFLAAIDGAV
jgi:putative transferase (TIGR04331 family)